MIETGEDLKASRKRLGLTVEQMAGALRLRGGNAADHVREMERGNKPITGPAAVAVDLMVRAADLLEAIDASAGVKRGDFYHERAGLRALLRP